MGSSSGQATQTMGSSSSGQATQTTGHGSNEQTTQTETRPPMKKGLAYERYVSAHIHPTQRADAGTQDDTHEPHKEEVPVLKPEKSTYQKATIKKERPGPFNNKNITPQGAPSSVVLPMEIQGDDDQATDYYISDEEDDRQTIGYDDAEMPALRMKRERDDDEKTDRKKSRLPETMIKLEDKKHIKLEDKKHIKLEDKKQIALLPETKVKVEGKPASSSRSSRAAAEDDDLQVLSVQLNKNTDMDYWKDQSSNEIRSQIQMRKTGPRGTWAARDKDALLGIVRRMIKRGLW